VIRFFALALPFYVLMGISASFAQSFRQIKYQQGILNFFLPVMNFTLVALSFLMGFKLEGAIFGFIVSGVLSAGLGFYFLKKIFPQFFSFSSKPVYQIKQLLRFSIPMFFIGMSLILLSYTDKIMLGFFKDAKQVGIYNAAAVISLQLTMSLGAFIIIFSPIVSDLFNRKKFHELKKLFKTVTRWGFSVSLPLFVILTVFSKEIVLVFGPEFRVGWNVLIVLAFAQLVNVGTGPVGMILQMTGKQNVDFFNGITLLLINVGLNLWLIPQYGFLGAAVATATSLILIHLLRLIEVIKIYRMGPYDKHHVKPVIAGLVMFFSGILFKMLLRGPLNWILVAAGILILTMVYLGMIIGLGFNHEDKIIVEAVKSKILRSRRTVS
jgi:O-antigen/teichoic acid export membrane protein